MMASEHRAAVGLLSNMHHSDKIAATPGEDAARESCRTGQNGREGIDRALLLLLPLTSWPLSGEGVAVMTMAAACRAAGYTVTVA